jgi:hypothetical protein
MTEQKTAVQASEGFDVDAFAAFWDAPDLTNATAALADDAVAHWPGEEPVRGSGPYVERLQRLLDRVPDLRLEVAEHAQNGEHLFIRWIARGTGAAGPFQFTGIDRIEVENGLVKENYIRYDSAELESLIAG